MGAQLLIGLCSLLHGSVAAHDGGIGGGIGRHEALAVKSFEDLCHGSDAFLDRRDEIHLVVVVASILCILRWEFEDQLMEGCHDEINSPLFSPGRQ